MKYNIIEIKPNHNKTWSVFVVGSDDLEREEQKEYLPNSLGFFYFPKDWETQKAFEILKESMIDSFNKEVEKIQNSIKQLAKLELPQSQQK